VLSDDIEWCKVNVFGPDVIYSERRTPGEDLALSSLCDHAITTYGTFSLWVAWFADGLLIRPRSLAPINSATDLLFQSQAECYPSDTIVM